MLNLPKWFVLGLALGGSLAFSSSAWAHGHWPEVPLVDTSCHKVIRDLIPEAEYSFSFYNSIRGDLILGYFFADGTYIEVIWTVLDLAHEEAADYRIKLSPFPREFSVRYNGGTERWVNQIGNGDCKDYKQIIE